MNKPEDVAEVVHEAHASSPERDVSDLEVPPPTGAG